MVPQQRPRLLVPLLMEAGLAVEAEAKAHNLCLNKVLRLRQELGEVVPLQTQQDRARIIG